MSESMYKDVLIMFGQEDPKQLHTALDKAMEMLFIHNLDPQELLSSMARNIVISPKDDEHTVASMTVAASVDFILAILTAISKNPVIAEFDIRNFIHNYKS